MQHIISYVHVRACSLSYVFGLLIIVMIMLCYKGSVLSIAKVRLK